MANEKVQDFKNHTRIDPLFMSILAVGVINVGVAIYKAVTGLTLGTVWCLLLSLAALLAITRIRVYALKVQDRLIRLEETLRMQQCLPASLCARVGELTESQIVALRFASTGELQELVEKTLANKSSNKEIKQAIRTWRPDYFRV